MTLFSSCELFVNNPPVLNDVSFFGGATRPNHIAGSGVFNVRWTSVMNKKKGCLKLVAVTGSALICLIVLIVLVNEQVLDELKFSLSLWTIIGVVLIINIVSFISFLCMYAAYRWIKKDFDDKDDIDSLPR